MHYSLKSPKQKKDKELEKELNKLNSRIDKMIYECKTDRPEYQQLLKIHKNLYVDLK